jgi:hypothetical protein
MNAMKLMFAACVLTASSAMAVTAVGPICDANARVGSTTYYSCSSGSHTALDMSNRTCNQWNHRAMLIGSYYYGIAGGCGQSCTGNGCNGGAGNYATVKRSGSLWDFRQLHISANGNTVSKTTDRGVLGLVGMTGSGTGAHVHADNRYDRVRSSAWYRDAGTTCGSSANCTSTVGYPRL